MRLPDLDIYRPKRSFGQGNIFTSVCHSVHREGGSGPGGCLQFSGGVPPSFRGVSNFLGGLQFFWGVSNFSGGSPIFSGVSSFSGGVSPIFWGSPIFRGGLQFCGGVSNFSGGLQFFGGSPIFRGSPIFWGGLRGVKGDPHFLGGGNFFFDFCFLWGYTPPPGPDTGIWSTFGRYASYWNAFLFEMYLHIRCEFSSSSIEKLQMHTREHD